MEVTIKDVLYVTKHPPVVENQIHRVILGASPSVPGSGRAISSGGSQVEARSRNIRKRSRVVAQIERDARTYVAQRETGAREIQRRKLRYI